MGTTITIVVIIIVAIYIIAGAIKHRMDEERRKVLLEKYGDPVIVDQIMKQIIWQGMSEEQLIDSWGQPISKDQKIYKSKIVETFKYNQTGKNRYRNRVKVENGIVVGWNKNGG